jgi:diaminopropionate ammonia-lyase
VYLPKGSAQVRFDAIASHGADTSIIDGNYDDTVARAADDARTNGWTLIQDTAWQGYEEIPQMIMQGYLTIVLETLAQLRGKLPTHVFVQCGVGSLAAAVLGQLNEWMGDRRPVFVVVEPLQAACCYQSMAAGGYEPRRVEGALDTVMAGLACGQPSVAAWRHLRDFADVFVACSDEISAAGMRLLAHPRGGDPGIVSGESGAVTAGLLAAILGLDSAPGYPGLAAALNLDQRSNILLISTEGNTDPESYARITQPHA